MEKLSVEEKAKRYDEALERARKLKKDPQGVFYEYSPKEGDTICDYIFPELKENEDEKIREGLIGYFRAGKCENISSYHGISTNDILAWLEKQGEQKPADKVEPKFNFNVGQWIVATGKCTYLITKIKDFDVTLVDTNGNEYVFDTYSLRDARLYIIQDAKVGDVLVHNGCTFIFMGIKDGIVQALEETLLNGINTVNFGEPNKNNEYHPATKEQRDILFQKMKEVGYEWDAEKKELKKIEQPTTAWSEEDERLYRRLHNLIYSTPYCDSRKELSDWLESLKHRNRWRPSDEQMNILFKYAEQNNKDGSILTSLYQDLKRLKE